MRDFVRTIFVLARFDLLLGQALPAAPEAQDCFVRRALRYIGQFRRERLSWSDDPPPVRPDPEFFIHGTPPPNPFGGPQMDS
jgi:hypothetical protein